MEKTGSHILISIVSWKYLENVLPMVQTLLAVPGFSTPLVVVETGGDRNENLENLAQIHSRLKLIYAPQNEGYAAAHALSVQFMQDGGFDGILLLNPDLRLEADHLTRLKKIIAQTENRSVIGAPVYNETNGTLLLEYPGFPVTEADLHVLESARLNTDGNIVLSRQLLYGASDLHGCFLYFPAQIIRKNGWMHRHYFLYGEENEYLHRLKKAGENLLVSSELSVLHENGGTFKQGGEGLILVREYYRTRNRLYNNFRFDGWASLLRFNFGFVVKYALGRYLFRLKNFRRNDLTYYNFLGHLHFLLGIRGRYLNPENF